MAPPPHVILRVRCTSCGRTVELECAGLPGFWGYRTYNEYACPHCRKQNHALSPGAVIVARAAWSDDPDIVTRPDATA